MLCLVSSAALPVVLTSQFFQFSHSLQRALQPRFFPLCLCRTPCSLPHSFSLLDSHVNNEVSVWFFKPNPINKSANKQTLTEPQEIPTVSHVPYPHFTFQGLCSDHRLRFTFPCYCLQSILWCFVLFFSLPHNTLPLKKLV